MSWNYYIAHKTHWQKYHLKTPEYCVGKLAESHHFDFGDGDEILIAAIFHDVRAQDAFESEAGVIPFPHIHSLRPIGAVIATKLAAFGLLATDTTFEAGMKLRKHLPVLDPRWREFSH